MRTRSRCALAALACFALSSAGLAAEIRPTMEAGAYPYPIRVYFSSDDKLASLSYRFEGAKNVRPLDEALFLDALPGEERVYSIFVEARTAQGKSETASFLYRIDRKPPDTPVPSQAPGVVLPGTPIGLSSRGSNRIMYGLMPAQPDALPYEQAVRIPDYQDGIVRYVLTAVALDELGNASFPFSGEYVSLPKGFSPSGDFLAPAPSSAAKGDPDPVQAAIVQTPSGFTVRLSHPRATAFRFGALGSGQGPGDPSSYPSVAAQRGEAIIGLTAPAGWIGNLSLAVAAETQAGQFVALQKPLSLSFLESDAQAKTDAVQASLIPASRSRGAWFIADSSKASVRYQVEGQEPRDYSGPVFIQAAPGRDSLRLSYSALFRDGKRSKDSSLEIELPSDPGLPQIEGMPAARVSASTIVLSPGPQAKLLRYELSSSDAPPKPVGPGSPVFDDNTAFNAPEGATVAFKMRVRSFSSAAADAVGGDEAFFDFAVDRTPPDPPAIKEQTGLAGAPDKFFGFDSGNDEVYYRVSRDGVPAGSYLRFTEPIRLPADADGAVTYSIQAYAIDLAGNRSSESSLGNIIIDATSVYLAGWGSDQNDGSPSSPLASLEAALKNAVVTGRNRIKVSGSPKPSGDLVIEGDMRIEGGFGKDWSSNDSSPASLSIRSISQKAGLLSLSELDISGSCPRGTVFLSLAGSAARIERSSLRIASRHDEAFSLSKGAILEVEDSSVSVTASGRFTALMAEASKVSLARSTFSLGGPDIGTAISAVGGSLGMEGSSLSCDSAQSSASLALSDSVLSAVRSLFDAAASKGFAACIFSRGSSVSVDTSLFRSSRSAETVFYDFSGGSLRLANVTAFADGSPRAAYAFRLVACALDIRNSAFAVMNAKADGALFDGVPDPKGLQSVCSGGFRSLVKGGASDALASRVLVAEPSRLFEIDAKGWPRLAKGSPLIDAGSVPEGVGSSDWYGNPRPSSYGKGLPDIGAFEYQ